MLILEYKLYFMNQYPDVVSVSLSHIFPVA